MSAFDSEHLIELMSHAGRQPESRLISLFDLLDIELKKSTDVSIPQQEAIFNSALFGFCMQLAREAKANNPDMLVDHLLFIAQNAFNQQLTQPEQTHLVHAKKVAEALILAQFNTKSPFFYALSFFNRHRFAVTASALFLFLGGFLIWQQLAKQNIVEDLSPTIADYSIGADRGGDASLTAQEASAMYAKFETMRSGTCQFLEAIQIPDKDKAVYLESVVGGKLPTNLKDLATANGYLEKVRCNYTPMLMRNSK